MSLTTAPTLLPEIKRLLLLLKGNSIGLNDADLFSLLMVLFFFSDSCIIPTLFVNSITSCYDFYSEDEEDKLGWDVSSNTNSSKQKTHVCPENWNYRSKDELESHDSLGLHALYKGGGYIANLGYNGQTAGWIINDLTENKWIDRQTRVVLVEVSSYNAGTKLLADAAIYFEMLPSGFLEPSMKVRVMPWVKSDSVSKDVYLVIFLIFGFVVGYFLVTECIKFFRMKFSYFSSIWNWLEMLQIISSVLVVAFSIQREITMTSTLQKLKLNPHASISFHNTLSWFEKENSMICVSLTVAVLRVLRLLKLNSHIVTLFIAIRKSARPLMSFTVVFAIVFIAYGHAGLLLFGKNAYMFSSLKLVMVSQFLMSLGSQAPRKELKEVDWRVANLYSGSFIFITMTILINMFVAILNEAQMKSTNSAKDEDDIEVANLLLSKFLNLLGINSKHPCSDKADGGSKENPNGEVVSPVIADTFQRENRQRDVSITIDAEKTNTLVPQRGSLNDPRDAVKPSTSSVDCDLSGSSNIQFQEDYDNSPNAVRRVQFSTQINVRYITVMPQTIDFDKVSEWIKMSAPLDSKTEKKVDFAKISRWIKSTNNSKDLSKSHATKKSKISFDDFRVVKKMNSTSKARNKMEKSNVAQLENRLKRLDKLLHDLDLLE